LSHGPLGTAVGVSVTVEVGVRVGGIGVLVGRTGVRVGVNVAVGRRVPPQAERRNIEQNRATHRFFAIYYLQDWISFNS